MGIHKLTAGNGYTYLTRHIAGGDVDRARGQDAAEYYTAEGNPPGRWYGGGLTGLGLKPGDVVTEQQMRALFGLGVHPDAEEIVTTYQRAHLRSGMSQDQIEQVTADARAAASLGRAFVQYAALPPFEERVNARLAVIGEQTRRPPTPAEISKVTAEESKRARHAVAGYDLVFTPVKSASLLWGLHPDPAVRMAVRAAHEQAVASALAMLEEHAAFTRTGHAGLAQVDTRGLVAVAFDHYDSRAGDPNLHTHVVVSNKIQGRDGQWRALDARSLYRLTVAVSEHYNTVLQAALSESLGVTWSARWSERGVRRGEPVWEIDAIPTDWVEHYSRRRTAITTRYDELVADYRRRHGHDPYARAAHDLARQATLETRHGKKHPRSLEAARRDWADDLSAVFGPDAVTELRRALTGLVSREREPVRRPTGPTISQATVGELAGRVLHAVAAQRSTWTVWNVHAESERLLREPVITARLGTELGTGRALTPAQTAQIVAAVVAAATSPQLSITVESPSLLDEPAALRRADGQSVFVEHASARYTSADILAAEDRLLAAARTIPRRPRPAVPAGSTADDGNSPGQSRTWGRLWDRTRRTDASSADPFVDSPPTQPVNTPSAEQVAAALAGFATTTKTTLDDGQRDLVTAFTTDPRLLVAGIGAAGTGKTTAMRAYLHTLTTVSAGRSRLVPLATSSHAAAVLAEELGIPAENLHKFLYEHTAGPHAGQLAHPHDVDRLPAAARPFALCPGDVVLLDEAGMAGTFNLDTLVQIAANHGATVRLLGDPAQLSAVESGGALRLIVSEVGAAELSTVHRFTDPDEAAATLLLRGGDSSGLDFYTTHQRIEGGSKSAMIEAAYTGWRRDIHAGKTSFLPAATNTDVTALSGRARADRVTAGQVEPGGVELHDGNLAGRGDWIVTRRVNRRLTLNGGKDFVRNGDAWTVLARHQDGSLQVEHFTHHGRTTLPATYVRAHVELLYATTAHRVQGGTVDTAHPLITDNLTREHLYVMATRARERTTFHVATHDVLPLDEDDRLNAVRRDPDHRAALEVLHTILTTDQGEHSATETIRTAQDAAASLSRLIPRYLHALPTLTGRRDEDGEYANATSPAAGRSRSRFQYDDLIGQALGSRLANQAAREPAWAALQAALTHAEHHGHNLATLLRQTVNRRELADTTHLSQTLAHRIHQHLVDANGCTTGTFEAIDALPHPTTRYLPPWVPPAPPDAHPYLPAATRLIEQRVQALALIVYRDRPAWSHALGRPPLDAGARSEWLRQAGTVAAYREQHEITGNDPARPLGPYQEPNQPAHPAYWHAAAAITTARQLAHPNGYEPGIGVVRGLTAEAASSIGNHQAQGGEHRKAAIVHRIAVDTYLALPEPERATIVTGMIIRAGNLWYGPDPESSVQEKPGAVPIVGLDDAAIQPAHAPRLSRALAERGHLAIETPIAASGRALSAHPGAAVPRLRPGPAPLPPTMPQPNPGPSPGL